MKVKFGRKVSTLVLTAATMLLGAAPVFAGFNHGYNVTFHGEPLFAIKGDCAGLSAERRAWIAQDNLDNALAVTNDRTPGAVCVTKVNGGYTVQVDGHYIVTADGESATMENMTAQELANSWASAIRERLANAADTDRYVATLRDEHALKANISVTESDIVRTSDNNIPFRMAEGSLTVHPTIANQYILVLKKNVTLENGFLPERTVMTGVLSKDAAGSYIVFTSATTPDGATVKLTNVVASSSFSTEAPHPVLSLSMPANEMTGSREPAMVGVGAQAANIAVIEERSNMVATSTDNVQM